MHTYQQELINQKLSNDISEQEIAEYYGKNKELFKLETPLIKGLFIKVPLTAPQLNNVRRWYKSEKQDAVESLEKYSLQNAVKYEYFYDKWVSVTDVLDMIPLKVEAPEEYVDKHRQVELKDTAFHGKRVGKYQSLERQFIGQQIIHDIAGQGRRKSANRFNHRNLQMPHHHTAQSGTDGLFKRIKLHTIQTLASERKYRKRFMRIDIGIPVSGKVLAHSQLKKDSIGCLTFDTAVENRSLPAFSL